MSPGERISTEQADEIKVSAVWRIVWGYKRVVAAAAALSGVSAAILAIAMTPVYRAEVVLIEVRESNSGPANGLSSQLGGLASLAGLNLGAAASEQQAARAFLKSGHLIEEFIERNNVLPALARDTRKPPTLWRAVKRFRENILAIREDFRQGVTTVDIEWTDPVIAAQWANGFVGLANELIRVRAMEESRRNINYLNDQVAKTNVLELQRVMYNLIEGETKTLMIASGRTEYAFRVVDPAVAPEIRVRPQRTLMVLIGITLGFVAGVAIALWSNLLGRSARTALQRS